MKDTITLYAVVNHEGKYVNMNDNSNYTTNIKKADLWFNKEDCEITEPDEKVKTLKFKLVK